MKNTDKNLRLRYTLLALVIAFWLFVNLFMLGFINYQNDNIKTTPNHAKSLTIIKADNYKNMCEAMKNTDNWVANVYTMSKITSCAFVELHDLNDTNVNNVLERYHINIEGKNE